MFLARADRGQYSPLSRTHSSSLAVAFMISMPAPSVAPRGTKRPAGSRSKIAAPATGAPVDSRRTWTMERIGERRTSCRTGWSPGFTFWYDGGTGICGGSRRAAFAIIAWTS